MLKSTPLSLSLLLAITLTGVFAFLQVYSIQAILPLLINDLKSSEVQAGLAVGATIAAIALMSPLIGMISDAYGRKNLIVGSLLFLSIPTALLGITQTIEQMIVYRFLQGLAIPGITVVLIAYIGDEFDTQSMTRLMSLYVSGTVLGGFLGRFLIGHLSELSDWRTAFFIMATICALAAVWIGKTLPASQHFIANPNFQASLTMLIKHSKNRHVLTACVLGACILFSLIGCFTYINLHLSEAPYFLDSSHLANIFSLYLIGMVITPLCSYLLKKYGTASTILSAISLSAIGILSTLQTPLFGIILALVMMSSGVFITQAAAISYIAAHVQEGRSLASGLYYMCYYGGGTLGAWLCGLTYQQWQWHGVVSSLLIIQLIAIIVVLLFMKKQTKAA